MTRLGVFIIHNNNYKMVGYFDAPYDFKKQPNLFDPDDPLNEFPKPPFEVEINDSSNENIFPYFKKSDTGEYFESMGEALTPGGKEIVEIINIKKIKIKNKDSEIIGGEIEKFDVETHVYISAYIDLNSSYVTILNNNGNEENNFSNWFYDYYFEKLIYDNKFLNRLNNDRTYFILSQEDENFLALLTLHKGRSDLNVTEFDLRKIINSSFPDIRQNLAVIDKTFGGYGEDDYLIDSETGDIINEWKL